MKYDKIKYCVGGALRSSLEILNYDLWRPFLLFIGIVVALILLPFTIAFIVDPTGGGLAATIIIVTLLIEIFLTHLAFEISERCEAYEIKQELKKYETTNNERSTS